MRSKTGFVGILLATLGLLLQPFPALSCSAFLVASDDLVLFGNNEDYWNPATRMWFVPGEDGSLGRVYFGYDDLLPQGGMNVAGLAYDGFATPPKAVTGSAEKAAISEQDLIDTAMARCRTVEEVISLFSRYNLEIMEGWNLMFADRTGDSVIIEGDAMIRKTGWFQVSTNFHQSEHPDGTDAYGEGEPCVRFQIASEMLRNVRRLNLDEVRRVLASVHVEGRAKTLYSNIYDLREGLVYLYHFHDFQNEVVVDLKGELEKGPRVVALPTLFPRNFAYEELVREQTALLEERRAERGQAEIPVDVLARYVGRYKGPTGDMTVSLRGGQLISEYAGFDQSPLTPSSENAFYLLRITYDIDFVFKLDDRGRVEGVTIRTGESELFFPRVP